MKDQGDWNAEKAVQPGDRVDIVIGTFSSQPISG